MKRYVKAYDYPQPKYPWGSPERRLNAKIIVRNMRTVA